VESSDLDVAEGADAVAMQTFERMTTKLSDFGGIGHGEEEHSARAPFGQDAKHAVLQLLGAQEGGLGIHLAQVAELAASTAFTLGLSPAQVRLTRLGAELHDVGKMGIPESILDKAGPLTAEEQWFMQRHSEIGERILAAIPGLRPVAPIVRAVHERPDGRGYPDGLRLEEIPIPSLVIAVADAFDAMTHNRPYQRAIAPEHALAELRRHARTQFDATVVEGFARAIQIDLPRRSPCEPM
jgi:HD-GYP domain-containing protein (c-di-GMP phosphodiesterase class II)